MDFSENKITGFIAPGKGNPRNSEGSFLPLEDGRIAYAYSRYHGDSWSDHAACAVYVIYSLDHGDTWDTEHSECLVTADRYREKNVMSVTLRRMDNGDIGLFYLVIHGEGRLSSYRLRRYRGDFSHPLGEVCCLPDAIPGYYVVNNDRVVRLKDRTWVIPAALHPTQFLEDKPTVCDLRGSGQFFISRDDGVTWRQCHGRTFIQDPYSETGVQEPGLVVLPGGVLYCHIRTDRMYQYESVSLDEGEHWTVPQPSAFSSPASPMLIKQNPYSGKFYAVWNPVPEYFGRVRQGRSHGRTPLAIAESENGVGFQPPVLLEEEPERGFCYPAMEFLNDRTILLGYCSGGPEEGCCLNRITLRKITLK